LQKLEKGEEKSANFNLRIYKHRESIIRLMRKNFLDKFTKEGKSVAR